MYALWCYLVYGFIPKWKTIKIIDLEGKDYYNEDCIIGKVYIQECEKTGRVIKRRLKY